MKTAHLTLCAGLAATVLASNASAQLVLTTETVSDGPYLASNVAALIAPDIQGQIINTTVSINVPVDPFGDPFETWNLRLIAPLRTGPDTFEFATIELSDEDFTLTDTEISGTITSAALNGEIFSDPDVLGGWEIETFSDSGSPAFWGFGNLTWTVDVIVPAPSGLAAFVGAGACAPRRRRRA